MDDESDKRRLRRMPRGLEAEILSALAYGNNPQKILEAYEPKLNKLDEKVKRRIVVFVERYCEARQNFGYVANRDTD